MSLRMLSCVGLLAIVGFAQTPAVCDGLNHLSPIAQGVSVSAGETVAIQYQPLADVTVQFPEVFVAVTGPGAVVGAGTVQILESDPATGLPSTNVLGSGTFNGIASGFGGWMGPASLFPVTLSKTSQYWVTFSPDPVVAPLSLGAENSPPGPNVVASTRRVGTGPWAMVGFADQYKLRFRSINCNPPGTGPTWTSVGVACQGTGSQAPDLAIIGPPRINTNVVLVVGGAAPGTPAALFWAEGTHPAGLPLGGGCTLHLDLPSFATFAAQGMNPLVVGTLDGTGTLQITLPVPATAALVGQTYAFQAALVLPQGVSVGGTNVLLTQAQEAVIGF